MLLLTSNQQCQSTEAEEGCPQIQPNQFPEDNQETILKIPEDFLCDKL